MRSKNYFTGQDFSFFSREIHLTLKVKSNIKKIQELAKIVEILSQHKLRVYSNTTFEGESYASANSG